MENKFINFLPRRTQNLDPRCTELENNSRSPAVSRRAVARGRARGLTKIDPAQAQVRVQVAQDVSRERHGQQFALFGRQAFPAA